MITRRRVVLAFGLGTLSAPLPSLAQPQAKLRRIGFLEPLAPASCPYREFLQAMRELGHIEGTNIAIEARFADGKHERFPALAEELVKLKVELIIAQSTPGVRAVQAATATIPIVMIAVADPVGSGFVASLARPGGNITGLTNISADTSPKLLEFLQAAVPKLSRIAVMVNPANSSTAVALNNIRAAAPQFGAKILPIEIRSANEIGSAFAEMARQRPDAVIGTGDPLFRLQARQIADLALRHKLPTASSNSALVEAGGLLSYGASIADMYRHAATYVDKILKGARPRDLPVEQPTKFELVVNMKTAKALGIKVPRLILLQATTLIE